MAKIAIVHDWLTGMRGGERCLEHFIQLYPEADIFTLVHVPGATSEQIDRRVKGTSWLNRLPGIKRYYRALLPFFPSAARSLDLSGYDLIISLSHAAAKNISVPDGAKHICYCFTPMRYVWDQAPSYFGALTPLVEPILAMLRRWDLEGAKGVDHFAAISNFVAARIRCFYGRKAAVIYPPVDTNWIPTLRAAGGGKRRGEAFLYAGALVPYKRADLVVAAFNRLGVELWVAGVGPEEARLRAMAGRNINFFGAVSDSELAQLYSNCRALIFPGKEDFGMVPIECLAAGRPVIASYSGALRESLPAIKAWRSVEETSCRGRAGVFFRPKLEPAASADPAIESLVRAVELFMEHEEEFDPAVCRMAAQEFSPARFLESWRSFAQQIGITPGVQSLGGANAYGADVPKMASQEGSHA